MSVSAKISNIARGSLHDGPGIRTVVYFKGCGLRCRWCHNPETFSQKREILFSPTKCIFCGACSAVCPEHHTAGENAVTFLRDGCTACGRCADVCPTLALSLCGEDMDMDTVFAAIEKDRTYYTASHGGVTFSGGECLLQAEAVADIACRCRTLGISTAVETALFVPWENIEQVLPYIDLFYADLKIANSEKHRQYTGQDNALILENLRCLSLAHSNIIVRIPIIPGVNDTADDLEGFARILRSLGPGIRQVELLKYNILGASKYDAIGKTWVRFSDTIQSDEEMHALCITLEARCGLPCIC
ncbi:MAG: glycyl-radical enzyme activating protein [Oscillospiraceae bacterium]|nr:glycyl-radical enzyme activating protein [Oscillospiraceae bacterium]